jgi:hypothetical protein
MDEIIKFVGKRSCCSDRQWKILYLAQKKSKYTNYKDAVNLVDDEHYTWLQNPSRSIKDNQLLEKFFDQLMDIKRENDM